jgi:hypothetical protein
VSLQLAFFSPALWQPPLLLPAHGDVGKSISISGPPYRPLEQMASILPASSPTCIPPLLCQTWCSQCSESVLEPTSPRPWACKEGPPSALPAARALTGVGLQQHLRLPQDLLCPVLGAIRPCQEVFKMGVELGLLSLAKFLLRELGEKQGGLRRRGWSRAGCVWVCVRPQGHQVIASL